MAAGAPITYRYRDTLKFEHGPGFISVSTEIQICIFLVLVYRVI